MVYLLYTTLIQDSTCPQEIHRVFAIDGYDHKKDSCLTPYIECVCNRHPVFHKHPPTISTFELRDRYRSRVCVLKDKNTNEYIDGREFHKAISILLDNGFKIIENRGLVNGMNQTPTYESEYHILMFMKEK